MSTMAEHIDKVHRELLAIHEDGHIRDADVFVAVADMQNCLERLQELVRRYNREY